MADVEELAFTVFDSPIGRLLLAAGGAGLVRIALPAQVEAAMGEEGGFGRLLGGRPVEAPAGFERARDEILEYLEGRRTTFDLPLAPRPRSAFAAAVLRATGTIPPGQTRTYAEVAAAAGHPGAVRATGSALATNPLPIVVPCHRVVCTDGSLGGFLGGLDLKRQLLRLEARPQLADALTRAA